MIRSATTLGKILAHDILEEVSSDKLGFVLLIYDPGGHETYITHNAKDSAAIGACLLEVAKSMIAEPEKFKNVADE
jgi:hypothetical protein